RRGGGAAPPDRPSTIVASGRYILSVELQSGMGHADVLSLDGEGTDFERTVWHLHRTAVGVLPADDLPVRFSVRACAAFAPALVGNPGRDPSRTDHVPRPGTCEHDRGSGPVRIVRRIRHGRVYRSHHAFVSQGPGRNRDDARPDLDLRTCREFREPAGKLDLFQGRIRL